MNAVLYTQAGEKKGEVALSDALFGITPNFGLIHLASVRQLAHARQGGAQVKTRAMVRGGGRKPFKQKGTGRARQGTIRAPQMRGGGSVFGPTGRETFDQKMPKKMRRQALFSALSVKAAADQVAVLESFVREKPSTKEFALLLKAIGSTRKVLVVSAEKDVIIEKSVSNIPGVKFLTAGYLNTVDVMNADLVLFLESGLKKVEEIFVS
jgi:large subunit ribosomal protein L4